MHAQRIRSNLGQSPEHWHHSAVHVRPPHPSPNGRPMGGTLSNIPGFRSPSLGGGELERDQPSSEGFLRYTTEGSLPLSSPFLDITQSGQSDLDSHLSDVLAVVARVHYTMMSFCVARSLFHPPIGHESQVRPCTMLELDL